MIDNSDKIILDLCGGTGSWSKPYKDAGYTVHVITLPEYSIADHWIIGGGLLRFRKQVWKKDGGEYLDLPIKSIYGILAAPPCTMFSIARTTGSPRDFVGAMATVNNCLDIIQSVQINGGTLKFWALENPVGLLRRFLGNPPVTFEQWVYGGNRRKRTDLWGRFAIPKQTQFIEPDDMERSTHNNNTEWYSNPKVPDHLKHLKLDRSARRAITPAGFAEAFYKANK